MAYSETEKALAVEIVRRNSGVLDSLTLASIRSAIGPRLTAPTIRGWLKAAGGDTKVENLPSPPRENLPEKKGPPSSDPVLVQKVNQVLDQKLEQAAHRFIDHATRPETVAEMSGQQAMTSAGIAIDKMRLLRGLPTEIVAVVPDLIEVIRRKGYDPLQALTTMKAQFAALPDAPMVTEVHGAN